MASKTSAVAIAAPDMLADFKVSIARPRPFKVADDAIKVAVPAISDAAYVTRGAHVKSGAPVLLVQDGSSQTALSLAAVGAAIAGGVITGSEITALLGA